jgi:hypothetical protein
MISRMVLSFVAPRRLVTDGRVQPMRIIPAFHVVENAAENFALLRRLAASTIKQDEQVDAGTQTKRMRAAWDDEYREHLLQEF